MKSSTAQAEQPKGRPWESHIQTDDPPEAIAACLGCILSDCKPESLGCARRKIRKRRGYWHTEKR